MALFAHPVNCTTTDTVGYIPWTSCLVNEYSLKNGKFVLILQCEAETSIDC